MELCDISDLRAYGKAVARQGEDTGTSQKVLLSQGEKSLAEIFPVILGGCAKSFLVGLLNISGQSPIDAPGKAARISGRECSKKFVQQGRSPFDARSILKYVSTAKGRPAYAKPLQQAWNRWLVSRSFSEGCRLFSTFPW